MIATRAFCGSIETKRTRRQRRVACAVAYLAPKEGGGGLGALGLAGQRQRVGFHHVGVDGIEQPDRAVNRQFLTFLLDDANLTPYVEGSLGRWYPVTKAGQASKFWTSDPHRLIVHNQFQAGTTPFEFTKNFRFTQLNMENVWAKAMNRIINESITGAMLVRVLNAQMPEYNKFLEANTQARDNGMAILRLFATLMPVVTFVGNMASLTILALGGHFVINGNMSLGDFTAFSSYLSLLIFPIMIIGFMSNFIAQSSASYGRIMEVMNTPETADTGTISKTLAGFVEVKNISLSYSGKPVLKNVSFRIKPGTRTAVIGPTAAGKTQLLYLLTGLLRPDTGQILFDDIDLNDYDKNSFQQQMGFVFQDSVIFNISLRENIAFTENVAEEALNKAMETAELNDFIASLPEGLDTIVSERGTSLSGGQKQRIMLARALALNPKILLLDDFTARVDNLTEQKILQNIERNYPDLTLISVTQKIASVQHYGQILLLEEGELLASGTHEQLMKNSPEYIQIFNSQRSTNLYDA